VDVTLLYFEGCPHWKAAEDNLRVVADEMGLKISRRLVASAEDAEALPFAGSPTILFDGHDPFPRPDGTTGLACRVYQTPNGPAGTPSVSQLREALGRRLRD